MAKIPLSEFMKQGTLQTEEFSQPKPPGFIKTLFKQIPDFVKSLRGAGREPLARFLESERERIRTQTLAERATTELVKRPLKIATFLPRIIAGGLAEAGKTMQEFVATYSLAALPQFDLGEASLKAQDLVRGSEKQRELEKKLFTFEVDSFAEHVENIQGFLNENPLATDFEKKTLPLTLGVLMLGAEMTPFGRGKKPAEKLVAKLVKDATEEMASKTLRELKLPDELIPRIASQVAQTNDPNAIKRIIQTESDRFAKELSQGAKLETTVPAPQQAVRAVDDPLIQEARKYKSAEEFVKAQADFVHGGDSEVSKFDARKLTKGGELGKGVYFTGDEARAKLYGGTITNLKADLKNPLEITSKELWSDGGLIEKFNTDPNYTKKLIEQGYDGIIVKNGSKVDQGVVFDVKNTLTKSQLTDIWERAVRGLDRSDGRVVGQEAVSQIDKGISETIPQGQTRLRAEVSQELQRSEILSSLPSSKQKQVGKSIAEEYSNWKKAQEGIKGKWTSIRETAQDKFIRVRKLQEKLLGAKVTKVSDDINVDLAETLFHGRVHTRLQDVKDTVTRIDNNILRTAKNLKIADDVFKTEIDSFLHARHALERNARLGDGAAGLTNVEARAVLKTIENSPHKTQILKLADEISEVNRQTLQTLLDAEVISKELFDTLNKTYKNHVPLNRVMGETDDIVDVLSARGFDVRGTGIRKAVGSDKPVSDILTNVSANVEAAIVRAEKNLVNLTTLRFARKHKDLGLFEEISPKAIGKTFAQAGEEGKLIFKSIDDPAVLALREKGKPVYLKINDPRLALALKGVGVEKVPTLMRGIAFVTRLYAGLHTRFNYEFALSNFVRDTQEMMVEVANRRGFKEASQAARRQLFESKKSVYDFLMGKDTPGAKLYEQMKLDGGTTGGLALSTRKKVEIDIETIRRLNRSNPRQAAIKAIEVVDKWNTLFEDATRLSVYKTALENGATRKQAAFLAKESSVNFNKKGTAGPIINGLYMFSNASIQGTTKILRAMKNPKVAGAVIGTVGTTVYAVNEWNTSIDPEWRDKISKFDRTSNFTILLPTEDGTTKYITVPVAWGLKPIKVIMEYVYDAQDGHGDWQDAVQGVLTSVMEAYNPLAGDEDILNTLTPSILKTPMEIRRNRAWYGNEIRPEYDTNAPASTKYFKSLENTLLGRTAIKGTAAMSEATNGAIEISPADIVYGIRQYIGGVGRSLEKVNNTILSISRGEEVPARERPVLSRFLKEVDEEETLSRLFYNERERRDKEQARQKTSDVRRISPLYEQAQMLLSEDRENEAQAIVDALSDEDYEIYKTLKASDRRRDTTKLQIQMLPIVKSNQELLLQGKRDEAQAVVDALTDEEYEAYIKVKEQLGESLKPKTKVEDAYGRSKLGIVSDYAKAFTKDPGNAFRALFTKEKLGIVEGNLVELQRFYGIDFRDQGGSQEYKRTLMASQGIPWSEVGDWKLEHIVPVKAGGSSADKNLMLVNNDMHNFFTPIDIAVGNAVRQGIITRKQAEDLMFDFKVYKIITAEEVLREIE